MEAYLLTPHILILGDGSRVRLPEFLKNESIFLSDMLANDDEETQELPIQHIVKTKDLFTTFIRLIITIKENVSLCFANRQCRLPLIFKSITKIDAPTMDLMLVYKIASMLSVECVEIVIENWFITYGINHRFKTCEPSEFKPVVVNAGVLGIVNIKTNNRKRLRDEIINEVNADEKQKKILNFILIKDNV